MNGTRPFPRTMVGGVSMPRMIIGTNWILGYSHTSASADDLILKTHASRESIAAILEAYLEYDIDAIMAPLQKSTVLLDAIKLAEDNTGKKIIIIDTPNMDVTDTKEGRASALETIETSRKNGATFCFLHHSTAEKLVNKLESRIERLPDYLDMIRQNGMLPGLSAHMPELIVYSDLNNYDVESYLQIYNCAGFLMQVEVEGVRRIIEHAKKPVMTIKSMAAGRVSPYVGLSFSYATLRACDMVAVGAFTTKEVHEDVEIAQAAIDRRFPNMEKRASPMKTDALGGRIP